MIIYSENNNAETVVAEVIGKSKYDESSQRQLCLDMENHYKTQILTNKQINEYIKERELPFPYFIVNDANKEGWGKYSLLKARSVLPDIKTTETPTPKPIGGSTVNITNLETDALIPLSDPTYEPFGFYEDLLEIIKSRVFYPIAIVGMSGNGKTLMVKQICSVLKRELVRVNIQKRTGELDLFGGFELVNGNTIRREGPVITAMKRGAILLLDEVDLGTEELLCLQSVLEGSPYMDKKTNTVIYPAEGFNIISTSNTKGKGSVDGRYIGANTLNDAFLERFAITIEQVYPTPKIETEILSKNFQELGMDPNKHANFIKCLAYWADTTRKSFEQGASEELISTRRLVHIAKAFKIFDSKKKAVQMCLNRFEEQINKTFMDLYTKIDGDIDREEKERIANEERIKNQANNLKKRNDVTNKKAPIASDISFQPMAAKLSKRYGQRVVITKDLVNGEDVVKVYSHDEVCDINYQQLKSIGTGQIMEDKLARMVEVNKSNAG